MDHLHDLGSRVALYRQLFFRDSPNACDVFAVLRILDIAISRQLIALVAMLSAALSIALSGDRSIAATFSSYSPCGQNKVDARDDIVNSFRVVLDTSCVQPERCLRLAPHSRGGDDVRFLDATDFRRLLQRQCESSSAGFWPTQCVFVDELLVNKILNNEHLQHGE